jgi:hypothetical protein
LPSNEVVAADNGGAAAVIKAPVQLTLAVATFLLEALLRHAAELRYSAAGLVAAVVLVATKGVRRFATSKAIPRPRTFTLKATAGSVMTGAATITITI